MKTVKEYLSKLKATKNTFYNLDHRAKKDFQNLYKYLKKHSDKKVFLSCIGSAEHWLKKENEIEYIKKYKAMECISTGLIF